MMKRFSKILTVALMFIMTFAFSMTADAAKVVKEGDVVTLSPGRKTTVKKDDFAGGFYFKFTLKEKSTVNISLSGSSGLDFEGSKLLDSKKKPIGYLLYDLDEGDNRFLLTKGTYYVAVQEDTWMENDDDEPYYVNITAKLTVKKYKASNMGGSKKSNAKQLVFGKKNTIVGKAFNEYGYVKDIMPVSHYYKFTVKNTKSLKIVVDSASALAMGDATEFRVVGNGIKQSDCVGAYYSKAKGKNTTLVITDKKGKTKKLKPGTYTLIVWCSKQHDCVSFKVK